MNNIVKKIHLWYIRNFVCNVCGGKEVLNSPALLCRKHTANLLAEFGLIKKKNK